MSRKALGARHLAGYLLLSLIWGTSFLLMLRVVRTLGLVGTVALRSFVAAALLALLARQTDRPIRLGGRYRDFAIVGATSIVGQLAGLSIGTREIGTAMTAILVGTIPIFSIILAHAHGHERIAPRQVAGVALALAGLTVLVGIPSVAITARFLSGCFLTVFGCCCAAVGSVHAAVRLKDLDPLSTAVGTSLFGGLLGLPLIFVDPIHAMPGPLDWLNLAILGSVVGGLGYVLFFWLCGAIGATRAISVEFLVIVIGALIGILFLGEHLSLAQILGGTAVLAGCAVVLAVEPAPPGS